MGRSQEAGVGLVMGEQRRAVFRKLKKICLLGELLQGLARVGAEEDAARSLNRVGLFDKRLADVTNDSLTTS